MAVVLTELGEQWAAECMAQTNANDAHFIGWGTGAGTAAKANTDLFTPATEARVAGTVSVTGSGATAKYQVVGTLTADGAKTITNAGNWVGAGSGSPPSGGGPLVVKGDHGGIALAENDRIEYTITIDPQ
jgi:hypothetical protein